MLRKPTYFFHANIYDKEGYKIRYVSGSYKLSSRFSDPHRIVVDLKKQMIRDHKLPSEGKVEITQLNRL
jgi:hypothetical protein